MKKFNRILMSVAAVAACCGLLFTTSCKDEDETLGGAKAIYIEMDQTNISLLVGDTVRLSAHVSNVSGKEIVTPITWSVDDPSVVDLRQLTDWARKKNAGYVAPPVVEETPGDAVDPEEGEGDSEGEGDTVDTPVVDEEESEFEADGTPKGTRNPDGTITSPDGRFIYTPSKYWAIIGRQGAQGRTTNLRATLENGKFALTTVTVERSTLSGLLEPQQAKWASYYTIKDDVAWFHVDQIGIADEYDVKFEFEFTPVEGAEDGEFILPEETFQVDRENNLIGMAYIAPRSVGKGTCTIVIGNEEESSEASMEIMVMPLFSGGFEELNAESGLPKRPGPAVETPSNLKSKNLTKTMDINSVDSVGLCFYIPGDAIDIANAIKACKAGFLSWNVEGSGILVTREYFDEDYSTEGIQAGFVSYIKFTSGSRPGSARVSLSSPARFPEEDPKDNPYEGAIDFVCDITVADYNVSYPVNGIVVVHNNDTVPDNGTITIDHGVPFSLEVDTDPSESFLYRTPSVTSSAPDVLRQGGASENKHIYAFEVLKPGSTTLTFEVLGVECHVNVVVNDRVTRLTWNGEFVQTLTPGSTSTSAVNVFMASNADAPVAQLPEGFDLVWSSSDPKVATVAADASDSRKVNITAVGDGTTTISCTATGGSTLSYSLTVASRQDVVYSDDNTGECTIDPDSPGTWFFYVDAEDALYITFSADNLSGSVSGSDASVEFASGGTEEPCSFNLEFTGVAPQLTLNGEITLPDGTKIKFDNLTVKKGE